MLLKIPFYKNDNDGMQCMQVAMKSVLKYFLDKDFSLNELDKLTKRKTNYWTNTSQIVTVLYDLGLDLKYYSKLNVKNFLKGEKFIKNYYGKDADKILKFTDVPVLIKSIEKLINYNIFENRILTIEEILDSIKKGFVPLVLIDFNEIINKDDFFQGHFIVVTGFDETNIYYHESGPKNPSPNQKVKKEIFINAINSNGTDNDCVIVKGIR